MEANEEVVGGPKDQTHTSKRKRTRRQRTQSPIRLAINANEDATPSPATTSTEEEEDMANCLILLAQGRPRRENWSPRTDGLVECSDRYTSKRYVETVSNGNGKVGVYVYQCRTCDRTFPSFQALGGHRASHKRPKVAMAELSDDEDQQFKNYHHVPSLSLHMLSSSAKGFHGTKLKVHECSVCGAEFSSGQALGGHMRRHRGTTPASTTAPSPSGSKEVDGGRNRLSLDLNLPAPDEDHQREQPKLAFPSKQKHQLQQQSPLVFSATATLVDCHY